MSEAVLLTGAPGAGKSSVLDALSTLLEIEGVEHGAIESEQLTRGFPPLSNEILAEQLGAALAIQRQAGRTLFLVVFTAETSGQLQALLRALAADRVLVVALSAPRGVIARRLERREPDRWPGKAGLIAHARELAGLAPGLDGVELTFDTDGRDPGDLARELLAAMRARGLAPVP